MRVLYEACFHTHVDRIFSEGFVPLQVGIEMVAYLCIVR
jgi:hypothetical protein